MEKILNVYKKRGETPLECIERFRVANPEYQNISMTYAGRLDPLAEGVLIVLCGEQVHAKDSFSNLPKSYRVQALLGVATDTHDLLGIPIAYRRYEFDIVEAQVRNAIEGFTSITEMQYPPYSSKTSGGTPLFVHARLGTLPDVLPSRKVEIHTSEYVRMFEISKEELYTSIHESISMVSGDFRQEEISTAWDAIRDDVPSQLMIVEFYIECGSGVYMRNLARMLGEKLGIPALAFSIVRESVGEYQLKDSFTS